MFELDNNFHTTQGIEERERKQKTDKQTDRQTDRQTERQTDKRQRMEKTHKLK